jgi:diguanylate cyclase (GGDEF)-like protein
VQLPALDINVTRVAVLDEQLLATADVVLLSLVAAKELAVEVERIRRVRPHAIALLLSSDDKHEHTALVAGADVRANPVTLTVQDLHRIARQRGTRRQYQSRFERHALVVDDHELTLPSLVEPLKRAGFTTVGASSALDALSKLREHSIQVIVTDVMMPGLNGPDLIAAARRYDPELVAIAVTGFPSTEVALEAMGKGACTFLTKPVRPKTLVSAAERAWTTWAIASLHPDTDAERAHILIATPDAAVNHQIASMLKANWTCFTATNESHAVDQLKDQNICVALCTPTLQLDGASTVSLLHAHASSMPIVALLSNEEADACVPVPHAAMSLPLRDIETRALNLRVDFLNGKRQQHDRMGLLANRLHQSLRTQTQILDSNPDAMLIVGPQKGIRYANATARLLLGLTGLQADWPPFEPSFRAGQVVTHQRVVGGTTRILEVQGTRLNWKHQRASLVSMRDVTEAHHQRSNLEKLNAELKQANQRIQQASLRDPLTGLLNRRGLDKALFETLDRTRAFNEPVVAVLLDCDGLKEVNDTLGHAAGDIVLCHVARAIRAGVRRPELVARIGGDEFLFLLPGVTVQDAGLVAERVRLAISQYPVTISGSDHRVTASMGMAKVPPDLLSIETMLTVTHEAMKLSKSAGKDQVNLSTGQISALEPLFGPGGIHDGGWVRVYHQHVVNLETASVLGHELLSRGPDGPFHNPIHFLRLAHEHHVLASVDLHCLTACIQASPTLGDAKCHVNLFPSTMLDTDPQRLVSLFMPHDPSRFCVEISEQQVIGDPTRLKPAIDTLRAAGVGIALDDIGFGRSSLESLIVLEPEIVKIDRRYVDKVSEDPDRRRALQRLVDTIVHLDAIPVAEGIETESDRQVLLELGVTQGQGYLFDRPRPVPEA